MPRIFISYAREALSAARSIADDLVFLGMEVWYDQELSGGQSWWDTILAQVRQADILLVTLSPETLDSPACKLEFQYARALHRHVLPVLVSTSVDVALLPSQLSRVQIVDRRDDDKRALLQLVKAVQRLPPPPQLPHPLPDPPGVPISYLGSLKEDIEHTADLSRAVQWDIVGRLKTALGDPRNAEAAAGLVERMRRREDLLAVVARELDSLAHDSRGQAPAVRQATSIAGIASHAIGGATQGLSWESQARKALASGNKIEAIKIVRAATMMGLKDAKDLVESWASR